MAPPAPLLQPDHALDRPAGQTSWPLAAVAPHPAPAVPALALCDDARIPLDGPYAVFVGIVTVLLGVIVWMGVQLWWPSASTTQDVRVVALPPPPAVQNYIQGQQTFNADLMRESLSTDIPGQSPAERDF